MLPLMVTLTVSGKIVMTNIPIISLLGAFAVMWLVYLFSSRTSRFAFALWFPLTATSMLGVLLWLLLGIILIITQNSFLSGLIPIFFCLSACPVVLVISYFQRPSMAAFSAKIIIPTAVLYFMLLASLCPISHYIEKKSRGTLQITLLDSANHPVTGAKIIYDTLFMGDGKYLIEPPRFKGEIFTDASGRVILPTQKILEIKGTIAKDGFYKLSFRVDRLWSEYKLNHRQATVMWLKNDGGVIGYIQTKVNEQKNMELTIFLPQLTEKLEDFPCYKPW